MLLRGLAWLLAEACGMGRRKKRTKVHNSQNKCTLLFNCNSHFLAYFWGKCGVQLSYQQKTYNVQKWEF
jgi:hypothetical protein